MEVISSRSSSSNFAAVNGAENKVGEVSSLFTLPKGTLSPAAPVTPWYSKQEKVVQEKYWRPTRHPEPIQGWEKRHLNRRRGAICDADGSLSVLLRLVTTKQKMENRQL